jgi:hypothetical protein
MNESSVVSGAELMKQTGFICMKLSYVTLWHFYIHHVVVTTTVKPNAFLRFAPICTIFFFIIINV